MDSKEIMIQEHLKGRDIHDERVLQAMRDTDRTLFVPDDRREDLIFFQGRKNYQKNF